MAKTKSDKKSASKAAKAMSALGASKGGKARANTMTPTQRSEIARKAVRARWAKAGKLKNPSPTESLADEDIPPVSSEISETPHALFSGVLKIGNVEIPCHVLSDGRRILHQRGMVTAIGMSRGGSSRGGGDRLAHFVAQKTLKDFVDSDLRAVTTDPIVFKMLRGNRAYGYEAEVLADICEAVLAADEAGVLQDQQQHIAMQCLVLIRGFARIGIIALIDEATGFQKVRDRQALQLKLQAFIADELQEWARMFPEEFWFELARLESVHYSPRHRPLRWGRYVMMFVYDAIDPDIGQVLRAKNPNPHFLKNHHQWLKKYGRDRVAIQIAKVLTIMRLCEDIHEFKEKFAYVFKRSPLQLNFSDINWGR